MTPLELENKCVLAIFPRNLCPAIKTKMKLVFNRKLTVISDIHTDIFS